MAFADHRMFELVNDIEAYPAFMNGCVGAQVLDHSGDILVARLDLSRMGFSHSFTTRNRLDAPRSMTMELVDGPFSRLSGEWGFKALSPEASKVSFTLEFELDNKIVSGAIGKMFEQVANEMVDGICNRARHLYS
ncbi:MAG: type II toxin-antitoxin system RatA family toxin [Candidatus Pelagadaptatus aseana]